jgi:hypothetical protein
MLNFDAFKVTGAKAYGARGLAPPQLSTETVDESRRTEGPALLRFRGASPRREVISYPSLKPRVPNFRKYMVYLQKAKESN